MDNFPEGFSNKPSRKKWFWLTLLPLCQWVTIKSVTPINFHSIGLSGTSTLEPKTLRKQDDNKNKNSMHSIHSNWMQRKRLPYILYKSARWQKPPKQTEILSMYPFLQFAIFAFILFVSSSDSSFRLVQFDGVPEMT